METQVGRKPPLPLSQPSTFYYKENILQLCTGADSYQYAGTHLRSFTNLSWKGATTPCSRLPASLGRELRPPDLVYQPLLKGSYNPLTEGYNPQHHLGPRFINFHTGSNNFNRTPLAGHISSYFQTGHFPNF